MCIERGAEPFHRLGGIACTAARQESRRERKTCTLVAGLKLESEAVLTLGFAPILLNCSYSKVKTKRLTATLFAGTARNGRAGQPAARIFNLAHLKRSGNFAAGCPTALAR